MICHFARRDHSLLDPLDLELYPLAKVTSMPKAGGEQLSRLLRLPASTHHSSARETITVAWQVFSSGSHFPCHAVFYVR